MKIYTLNDIPRFKNFPSYRVNCEWDYFINDWLPEHIEDGLNINPDFQRNHVWTENQQRKYVEYKLSGGYGSDILLFNHPGWMGSFEGDFVLVDGKQRIEAVRRFWDNEFSIYHSINPDGIFKDQLDRIVLRKADFIVIINNLKTKKEVLEWYIELNSGGTVHTEEEINKVKEMLENV